MLPFPGVISQLLAGRLIILESFQHRMGSILSLLEYVLTQNTNLPFLHTVLLSKLPSMDLQDTVFTTMVFHTALLLIKELTSQQKKCSNGHMLMEFAGLIMFPTIL